MVKKSRPVSFFKEVPPRQRVACRRPLASRAWAAPAGRSSLLISVLGSTRHGFVGLRLCLARLRAIALPALPRRQSVVVDSLTVVPLKS